MILKSHTGSLPRTVKEIELMQEYRTRQTADLVTGKLDVREAAAKLSDLHAGSDSETISGEDVLEETETMEEEG